MCLEEVIEMWVQRLHSMDLGKAAPQRSYMDRGTWGLAPVMGEWRSSAKEKDREDEHVSLSCLFTQAWGL